MGHAVELQAAKTLLDQGLGITYPAPWFLRLFGKKTIAKTIRQPYAGTALSIIALRLSMGVDDKKLADLTVDEAFALQVAHGKKVAQMVAMGILRERTALKNWRVNLLANHLLRVKTFDELLDYMTIICLGGGAEAFTNTIRLTRMLRLTAPNLSQATQKS